MNIKKYDCNFSQTCIENTINQYQITYGVGDAIGFQASDTVWLSEDIKIQQMDFILITETNQYSENNLQGDGILGLGLNSNLLNYLKNDNYIDNLSFSLLLTDSTKTQEKSMIILGGIDESLFISPLNYYPVIGNQYWQIGLSSIKFKNQQKNFILPESPSTVILDSGSSLILFDQISFQNFLNVLAKQYNQYCNFNGQQIICTCQNVSSQNINQQFPDIEFEFKNNNSEQNAQQQFNLQPRDYIIQQNQYCYLLVSVINDLQDRAIVLGDTFFFKYYVHFDLENKQIGVAQQKLIDNNYFLTAILIIMVPIFIISISYVLIKKRQFIMQEIRIFLQSFE
ncbi:Aspartic peptidase domain [Pseudocohnilembus persalinus]|uniref:Aspartic peptidase domain n=1 Tax=Pseudocohnilembus persalinus TaxID=266149 RepID=A0A0V0QCS6_PSEPJ|nr:Aspartic peptidase domain [Pseudocohnilembus persalinus]|eukprot:KRX00023.1 Aspartic peptidase domain [Pseudocohnilembus persalinus]